MPLGPAGTLSCSKIGGARAPPWPALIWVSTGGRARQFCCNPEYRSAMSFCRKPPNRGLATCISWILDFTTWVVLSINLSSSYSHKSKVSSNHQSKLVPPWVTLLSLESCSQVLVHVHVHVGHNISSDPATVITTKFLYYRYDAMLWFLSYSLCHVGDSGARVKSWGHTKLSIIILSTLRIFFWGGSGFSKLLKTRLLGTPVYLGQIRNFLRYPITWDVPCNWVITVT